MDALGLDGEHRLDIVLMQLVKLVRDGEVVRMSKRTGKAISLTDHNIKKLPIPQRGAFMIDQLIAEATECDFKVALETKKPKSWLKIVSAFSNGIGGTLFFGVSDDREPIAA